MCASVPRKRRAGESARAELVGIALIVFRGHDRAAPIPFGPFLAAGGWIALIGGGQLLSAWFHLPSPH